MTRGSPNKIATCCREIELNHDWSVIPFHSDHCWATSGAISLLSCWKIDLILLRTKVVLEVWFVIRIEFVNRIIHLQHDSQYQNITLISVLCSDIPYGIDKPSNFFGLSSPCWRLAQQQQPITERVYYTAWPVTPNLRNWPITDGLSSQVWKCCVREGDRLFQCLFPCVGLSDMGRQAWPGARVWNSLWIAVYDLWKVWTLAKMPWPGIKFTDFSRVLGKLIKFLDFSRAGKHFFVFPGLFPNSRTAGNHVHCLLLIIQTNSSIPNIVINRWLQCFDQLNSFRLNQTP